MSPLVSFASLAFVLVLQNVVTLSVNLADNLMLGGYAETALSGVAAVNQVQFIYQQLLMALGDGVVIFCARYWGARDLEPMRRISSLAMRLAIGISLILFALASLFPRQVLLVFTDDEAIIAEGARYLSIVRFSYCFFAVTQIVLATLRSIEVVRISFFLSILALVVNCCINYTLIYGRFGFPEMGVEGAAIGTLSCRIIELVVLLAFVRFRKLALKLRPSDYLVVDHRLAGSYFRLTGPLVFNAALWGLNTAMQTVILGHMTAAAIAANSASSTLYLLVKSTAVGSASAAGVVIGKAIGEGDRDRVKRISRQLQAAFLAIGVASGLFLFAISRPVMSLYHLRPEAMGLMRQFLLVLPVTFVGMSYEMPNNAVLKAGGCTKSVVKMNLVSIWAVVIPLSLFMAFVVHASPVAVVICLNSDQVFKCLPSWYLVNKTEWIRSLS